MEKKLKAIVTTITYTGKAGKSTTANNLLFPRMELAENALFRVETINESGKSGAGAHEQRFKGRDIEQILKALSKLDSAIVDIGTSNVESFVLALTQQPGAHNMFDYFVVPVEANAAKVNEFKEAIKTFEMLAKLGVAPERIKVVFNKLKADDLIEEQMSRVINYHAKFPIFTLNKRAVIHETLAFKSIEDVKKSYDEVLADKTDYWAMLKDTPLDQEAERTAIVKMARAQGLVQGLDAELDEVFNALFGTSAKKDKHAAEQPHEVDVAAFD